MMDFQHGVHFCLACLNRKDGQSTCEMVKYGKVPAVKSVDVNKRSIASPHLVSHKFLVSLHGSPFPPSNIC